MIKFLYIITFYLCRKNRFEISKIRFLGSLIFSLRYLEKGDLSFGNEYEILQKLYSLSRSELNYVVDIGASDGYSFSSTLGFFRKLNFNGLAIENDSIKFLKLSYLYSQLKNVELAKIKVTPNNISNILEAYSVPKNFTILNLDVDSYDFFIMHDILYSGFKPDIISMEINEKIPPGIFFTVLFSQNANWKGDHFYGCSLEAAVRLLKDFDYSLYTLEFNNAFFVSTGSGIEAKINYSTDEAYSKGYNDKLDRHELFPKNHEVDYWTSLPKHEAVIEIERYFSPYKGDFICFEADRIKESLNINNSSLLHMLQNTVRY